MDDLIDRQELLNNRPEYLNPQMEDEIESARHKGWNDCNSYYYNLIIKQPTVDTEQHAHWKEDGIDPYDDCAFYKCTNCNRLLIFSIDDLTPDEYGYRYCPFCGCKMEKNK